MTETWYLFCGATLYATNPEWGAALAEASEHVRQHGRADVEWQKTSEGTFVILAEPDQQHAVRPICGVCWASHRCHLPIRHEGDHGCIDDDDEGEPHQTCPRTGPEGEEKYLYSLDLLRYDGEFCDICGSIERADHVNAVLDHAMNAHPERWAREGFAVDYANYLGNGEWRDLTDEERAAMTNAPSSVTFVAVGPVTRHESEEQ